MGYPFAIVRIKQSLARALPLRLDDTPGSPIAGPFDSYARSRMSHAIRNFPYAQPLSGGGRDRFEIEAPGGGRLGVWLTPDGHLFLDSQAGLELALSLYLELKPICPYIAIEDPQREVLHDEGSFQAFIEGAEVEP